MKSNDLKTIVRDEKLGKGTLNRQRKEGYIPAIAYGPNIGKLPLTVTRKELQSLLSEHGNNAVITLKVEGRKPAQVMIKEIQTHPVTGHLWHVDFSEIAMNKLLRTEVQVSFTGEPEGVRKGGIVQYADTVVEVECLPADIPESLEVDIAKLDIGDKITVQELDAGAKVKILSDPEQVLLTIAAPRLEEEAGEEETEESPEATDEAEGEAEKE